MYTARSIFCGVSPFVADDKIALIGMSQGGGVILITLDGKEAIGKIAAGIAFYPHCTFFGLSTRILRAYPDSDWFGR